MVFLLERSKVKFENVLNIKDSERRSFGQKMLLKTLFFVFHFLKVRKY
jgi:hypothetical protein